MNREILFRAWCTYNQEMYTPENSPEYDFTICNGKLYLYTKNEDLYSFEENIKDDRESRLLNIVSMEYIGTKDKNGLKIFEGDIIPCNGQNCVVVFGKKTLGFGYHFKYITKWDTKDKFYRITSKDEVIGNIYQNPELIKSDK